MLDTSHKDISFPILKKGNNHFGLFTNSTPEDIGYFFLLRNSTMAAMAIIDVIML
jgi:hypothetical protein